MAFSFGAASTPAFGAGAPSFGAASAPAFGAAPATQSAFGSSFNFGAASAPPAASAPAFGQAASGASFNFSSMPAFGATAPAAATPAFNFAATPTASSPFNFASQPATGGALTLGGSPAPAFNFAQAGQGMVGTGPASTLATKDNKPLTHATKWEELSPQAQAFLLQLESIISAAKEDCRKLDAVDRLKDVKPHREKLEQEAKQLRQQLQGLANYVRADDDAASALREKVLQQLHSTETAVNVFKRDYAWREVSKMGAGQALPAGVLEVLSGPVVLPSAYLSHVTGGMRESMEQYEAAARELEQVLHSRRYYDSSRSGPLAEALPAALNDMHAYFIHCASNLEALHERIAQQKQQLLARRRQVGDMTDPFEEAERRDSMQRASLSSASAAQQLAGGGAPMPSAAAPASIAVTAPAASAAPTAAGTPLLALPSSAGTGTPGAGAAAASGGGLFSSFASTTPAASFGTPFGGAATNTLARASSRKGSKKK